MHLDRKSLCVGLSFYLQGWGKKKNTEQLQIQAQLIQACVTQ